MLKYLLPVVALLALAGFSRAESEYRHLVFFKFKEGTPAEEITRIEKEFAALPSKIDTITGFEWGTDISPEKKAKGFTHGFIVTFKDKAGLDVYLPHEAHQEFVKGLRPHLEDAFVFDFVSK
ncbi:Dabb family protein [Haloferula helveola]